MAFVERTGMYLQRVPERLPISGARHLQKFKDSALRAYADNDYPADHKPDWSIISGLWPYLLEFRGRVVLALSLLVLAKLDRKSTRLNSSHVRISYAVF